MASPPLHRPSTGRLHHTHTHTQDTRRPLSVCVRVRAYGPSGGGGGRRRRFFFFFLSAGRVLVRAAAATRPPVRRQMTKRYARAHTIRTRRIHDTAAERRAARTARSHFALFQRPSRPVRRRHRTGRLARRRRFNSSAVAVSSRSNGSRPVVSGRRPCRDPRRHPQPRRRR